ncbi:3'(2'),5'-bisphosphate nucleotidase CysQ family protein [Rhizobium bangladeshense]|uniref:3'(2'),5'-bisphosphate nucleotidase CysQ family protein n=1 Tax=Rhizobium bangladeshense TaxID=1138189 RepID=UPI001C82C031|nr:3'(2'),5'-bisphosphate nucleotidase CysQ [Rhizobium bangladeshense]MBX4893235.1 3'(2'),5'-bisphosphate nucleotidase CysQ [Rhizobium bangladeshense]
MDSRRRKRLITELIPFVRRAGNAVRALQRSEIHAWTKADRSPVTSADLASHQILLAGCHSLVPDMPVLSEEDTMLAFSSLAGDPAILLDPLDGTKEFIRGGADFTVNIALVEAGLPTAGLIYAPAIDRLFFSYGRHEGFFQTSSAAPAPLLPMSCSRSEPIILVSRSHCDQRTEQMLQALKPCEVRRLGSSLKFAQVATGEADIYLRLGPMMVWDCAPGQAIIEAAGGVVLRLDNSRMRYDRCAAGRVEGLVAARTSELAARALAVFRGLPSHPSASNVDHLSSY